MPEFFYDFYLKWAFDFKVINGKLCFYILGDIYFQLNKSKAGSVLFTTLLNTNNGVFLRNYFHKESSVTNVW